MPKISDTWCSLCNAGAAFHLNGRIDYYYQPQIYLPEDFNYASINFTDDNILDGSFRFSASVNQNGEACAGGIVVSAISFTLINYDGALDFSGYKEQPYRGRICLQLYTYNTNNSPVYLDLPVYYIASLKDNNGLVMIEAYDALDWLNARPSTSLANNDTTVVEVAQAILEQCRPAPGGAGHTDGVEQILVPPDFGNITISTEKVPFGGTTCAEMLRQLAECNGAILQIEVKQGSAALSGNPPDQQLYVNEDYATIPVTADAVIECEILDNQKDVGALRVYDYVDGSISNTATAVANSQMVTISGNPFLFGATGLSRASFILSNRRYQPHAYYPFTLTALCNPAIRPRDQISFSYHGTTSTTMVSSVEWTLGGYMTLASVWNEQEDVVETATWSEASLPMTPTISASIGTAGTSCATSTWLTQGSVTFEPGTYLILVNAFFSSNATGRRLMYFSETSSGSALDGSVYDARMAVDGAASRLKFQTIKTFETSTTLYLRAWQNSGSTLTFTAEYSSIKIF